MKKIIIILICLLFSGCNYIELNDIGIVTLLAIDYQDNNYNLTIEIKENKKENEESSNIYKAKGTSIEKAIQQLSLSIDKNLYFIDLNIILLNQSTINSKLENIVDYLTRDSSFGTNYNIIVDDNYEKTIKIISNKKKIVGEYIKSIFDNQTNNLINTKFQDFLKDFMSPYKDIILPYGTIKDNEYIINNAAIFNKQKIVNLINLDMVSAYNLLSNINAEYFIETNYEDNNIIYRINKNKSIIKYDNKIQIDLNINGSFIELGNINLNDEQTVNILLNKIKDKIKKDTSELINICLNNESDILGFKKLYFNKKRTKINNIKNMLYEINITVNLDREGLIFNSIGEEYEKNK